MWISHHRKDNEIVGLRMQWWCLKSKEHYLYEMGSGIETCQLLIYQSIHYGTDQLEAYYLEHTPETRKDENASIR